MKRHPLFEQLEAYARSADDTAHHVNDHLARCSRCRAEVESIRRISSAARALTGPDDPAAPFDRVRKRLAAGERVFLRTGVPVGGRSGPSRRVRVAAVAAAGLLALAVGLLQPDSLLAVRSELEFSPDQPRWGSEVSVSYRPTAGLAGERELILRARYRRPGSEPHSVAGLQEVADTLVPDAEGVFRGRVTLPDGVVYGAFAVEDVGGEFVDDNRGALWDLMMHDEQGTPLLTGLLERVTDSYGRSWTMGLETAVRATELYPDSINAWIARHGFERQLVPDGSGPADRAALAREFERLDRFYRSQRDPDPEVAAAMWYAAWNLSSSPIAAGSGAGANPDGPGTAMAYWRDQVRASDGYGPRAMLVRTISLMVDHFTEPSVGLDTLELYWDRIDRNDPAVAARVVETALSLAERVGADTEYSWLRRQLEVDPASATNVGIRMASLKGHEVEGRQLLEAEARRLRLPEDESRPLSMTRSEFTGQRSGRRASILTRLARLYLEADQRGPARSALGEASDAPWDPGLLLHMGTTYLELGDTALATEAYATASADPLASAARTDSLRTLLGDPPESVWTALIGSARERVDRELQDRLAVILPAAHSARVLGPDGERVDVMTAVGRPTVVSLWSAQCGWSLRDLANLQRLQRELADRGVRHFAVKDGAESDGDSSLVADWGGAQLALSFDPSDAVTRAFNLWATPSHVLLDGQGRVRWLTKGTDQVDQVLRMVELLR